MQAGNLRKSGFADYFVHCVNKPDMIEYKLIRELEQNPSHTQRSLAKRLNVSLGKVNFVLAGFIGKGLVKAQKLQNPKRIHWQYVLTAKGMKEKLRIAHEYLGKRLSEYDQIQREIEELEEVIRVSSTLGK